MAAAGIVVVSGWDSHLTIINADDPTALRLISTLDLGALGFPGPRILRVVGDYAYFTCAGIDTFAIVDISDVRNPVLAGSVSGAGAPNWLDRPGGIWVEGNYAYVCAESDDCLTIIDITNPAAPNTVAHLVNFWIDAPARCVKSGNYIYLTSYVKDAFVVIDVTNPLAPVYRTRLDGAGAPNFLDEILGLAIVGNLAFVTAYLDRALTIIDITNPLIPALVGSIQGGGGVPPYLLDASEICVSGNYAYITTRTGDESLTVIDVSNPAAPAFAAVIQGTVGGGPPNWLWGTFDVRLLGNYAYVTAAGDDSVTVIDISNPLNPTFVSSFRGAGTPNFLDLTQGMALISYTATPLVQTNPTTEIEIT